MEPFASGHSNQIAPSYQIKSFELMRRIYENPKEIIPHDDLRP